MTDGFWKLASASALALSLLAAPAMADFIDWDGDEDGLIDETEWNEGFGDNAAFAEWDEDEDGLIDEDEYSAGVFDTYDENDDGLLDEEEYGLFEEDEDDWF